MNGLIITVTSSTHIPSGQNSVMVLLHEEGIASGVPENEKREREQEVKKILTENAL
ncbi:hypothetical protein ACNKHX_02410 [Shigella flexneri]